MKLIPAIDLKNRKCVRLQRGKLEDIKIFNEDPIEQAIYFQKKGCQRIHVVDLDGAFGKEGVNTKTILDIKKNINIPIELGGGIKNEKDICFWMQHKINFLILGSLSVKDSNLVLRMADEYKNRIYVALDVLREKVMIKGWLEESKLLINDIFKIYNQSSIKGYILTDVSRDGMLEGLNFNLIEKIISMTKKNIIVGGGLSNYSDIQTLKDRILKPNLEGFIAGKSIYDKQIEIDKVMELLKNNNTNNYA